MSASRLREYKPIRRYQKLRKSSRLRGIILTLSLDQYKELLKMPCYYCEGKLPKTGAGLDRIDSSKGYTPDNVLPCCTGCNSVKGNLLTSEELFVIVQALKEIRKTNNIWSHKHTTAQKRKRRK